MEKQGKVIGLVYNPRIQGANKLAKALYKSLDLGKSSWVASALEVEEFHERMAHSSLVITLGGDGTILRTAQVASRWEAVLGSLVPERFGASLFPDPATLSRCR